ncbi:MAG: hypothetical protein WC788_06810 [Candidatus Paceibacterota bacterium]|jgi:hypothetical protein
MIMIEFLQIIIKRKRYFLPAIAAMLFVEAVSYYLTVVNVSGKDLDIYAEMNGTAYTIISMIMALSSSVLSGLFISLLILRSDLRYKIKLSNGKPAGILGIGTGIIVSGCPSCGAPLLALLGMPFGLMTLPLRGLEIKLSGIIFLLISIYLLCENIKKSVICRYGDRVKQVPV